jgi:hypothetical protein
MAAETQIVAAVVSPDVEPLPNDRAAAEEANPRDHLGREPRGVADPGDRGIGKGDAARKHQRDDHQ